MPYFVSRKSGVFLNAISVSGTRVRPCQVLYGGTKGFLNTESSFSFFCFVSLHFSFFLLFFLALTFGTDLAVLLAQVKGHARVDSGIWATGSSFQLDMPATRQDWPTRDVIRSA